MAACLLLRTTNYQLHALLLRMHRNVAVTMGQSVRSCQDDSKLKKLNNTGHKNRIGKKTVKASGPAVSLLEKDLQDILQEHQKEEKLEERNSLQRRIDLLLSLGCTLDQIEARVKILGLSEQVVLQRASLLKENGCTPITVDLLLSSYHANSASLHKYLHRREAMEKAMCAVFRCSRTELDRLKKEHRSLNRIRCVNPEDILEKEKLLQSYGITGDEIRAFPEILSIRVANIRKRLEKLKLLREQGTIEFDRYPLKVVVERTRSFDSCIKRAVAGRVELDGSPITYATIAQRLGVTAKDVEDASINFYKMGPSSVLKKIDYLLGQGISGVDIVSHIYMMKHRLETIQKAVEKSKSLVLVHPPSIYVVLSFLRSGRLPQKSFASSRQRIYIASLLGVQAKELPGASYLRPLWSSDRICIKRNFDFLVSEGFSVQDIFSCLILLAHDPNILQDYYQKLWKRPEVAAYFESEVQTDKKQTLSLLQYVMEKDMNFASIVFHADVEYEQGVAGKESLDSKSPGSVGVQLDDKGSTNADET